MVGCCGGSQDGEEENTGKTQRNTKRGGERGRGTQEIERERETEKVIRQIKC